MITLNEQVDIPAPFERIQEWLRNFQEEFVRWSPYHLACHLYDGGYAVGNRVQFREIVMGLDYDVTGTIMESEQDADRFKVVFESDAKTAVITFEAWRTVDGIHFSHTESFGFSTPVIGPIVNFLIFNVFFRKNANWELIRKDMILDNQYLIEILVEGKYPERLPMEKLVARKSPK